MMFAAPELFEAERIDLLDEIEVAAELQHRMLADRGMRGEEGSEFEACHGFLSGLLLLLIDLFVQATCWKAARQSRKEHCGLYGMVPCAQPLDRRGCQAVGRDRGFRESRARHGRAQQPRYDHAQGNCAPWISQQRHQFLARPPISPGTPSYPPHSPPAIPPPG